MMMMIIIITITIIIIIIIISWVFRNRTSVNYYIIRSAQEHKYNKKKTVQIHKNTK